MSEAEVLYSDVKFKRGKREAKEAVSSSADTTYSEIKISKPPTAEQPEVPQQAVVSKRSKVTSERVALLVLSVLLAAALTALCVITFDNMKMKNELRNLEDDRKQCVTNLTETLSRVKACSPVQPTCPTPEVRHEPCYRCEEGWEQHGGRCYHFSTNNSTWNESRAECGAEGGDLVKIDSREEQMFLDGRVRALMSEDEDKFWIGLTDSAAEGSWVWVDGSPLDESLKFWSQGEPDNWKGRGGEQPDGEDCVRMGERGGGEDHKWWFDAFCSQPHRSVCEKAGESGRHECVCKSVQPVED